MDGIKSVPKGPITPLWIVGAFLGLIGTDMTYAIIKTTGPIQWLITLFVILVVLLVMVGFFVILWNRPQIFYPPSEYGLISPKDYKEGMSGTVSPKKREQIEMLRRVESPPQDKPAS